MTNKNKLSEGAVGKKLIDFFTANHGSLPVQAETLSYNHTASQVQYRITFANGDVSDWLITFEVSMSEDSIISAEHFNQVI